MNSQHKPEPAEDFAGGRVHLEEIAEEILRKD
jgi:hypothetical protein